jgi:hypothetical protein
MIAPHLRPGYTAIEAANKLPADSDDWGAFMKDVMGFPLSMLPSVQRVICRNLWKIARDPLGSVRGSAERDHRRILLRKAANEAKAK